MKMAVLIIIQYISLDIDPVFVSFRHIVYGCTHICRNTENERYKHKKETLKTHPYFHI